MTNEQRERAEFNLFVEEVATHNPAGLSDIWINAAWQGWKARYLLSAPPAKINKTSDISSWARQGLPRGHPDKH